MAFTAFGAALIVVRTMLGHLPDKLSGAPSLQFHAARHGARIDVGVVSFVRGTKPSRRFIKLAALRKVVTS